MATRVDSTLQEELVALYLRLNGYFVSGFIAHSPTHGRNRTELDALAVRFPFSCEPERQMQPDPVLQVSDSRIDLVLGEVKSRGQQLRFNKALTVGDEALESVLRWAGLFPPKDVPGVATTLRERMSAANADEGPATVDVGPNVRVRAVVFSPELYARRPNQPWCIDGHSIMKFIWECVCPRVPRDTCSTTYDLQVWGRHERIVNYFKSRGGRGPGEMTDMYNFLAENAP